MIRKCSLWLGLAAVVAGICKTAWSQGTTNCAPPPGGLIAWWPGDGNANDLAGANHGTLENGATATATGKVGQAFSFDGGDALVRISNHPLTDEFTAMTIEAWVLPTRHGHHPDGEYGLTVVSKTQFAGFALRVFDGYVQADFRLTGGDATITFRKHQLLTNSWSHIAVTYDGSRVKGFLNGEQLGSAAASGTIKNDGNALADLMIGNEPDTNAPSHPPTPYFGWKGLIDEPSIYDRALTSNEIATIFDAGSADKCLTAPPVITQQPTNQTRWVGEVATFAVLASGTPPLRYEWSKDNVVITNNSRISGATIRTLQITHPEPGDAGSYSVIVSNAFGWANSASATLKVLACLPAPAGIIGWWPGEGNANDLVGINHGILENGATATATGKVGHAFSFVRTNSLVRISNHPFTNEFAAMTIEAWVWPVEHGHHPDGEYGLTVVSKTQFAGFALRVFDGYVQADFRLTSGDAMVTFDQQRLLLNSWSHIAVTYDGSFVVGYLNGVEIGRTNASGTIKNDGNALADLMIGNEPDTNAPGYPPAGGFGWKGLIDEPSVYDRALAGNEITAIYHAGSDGKCPGAPPVILLQPTNQILRVGETATFSVLASGTPPLSYEWSKDDVILTNNSRISGATSPLLKITDVELEDSGNYRVVVHNSLDAAESTPAFLNVLPCVAPPAGLIGWWPGDGNAWDIVGARDVVLRNGAGYGPGKVGPAFSFDGVDDYAEAATASDLQGITDTFTIEFWARPNASRNPTVETNSGISGTSGQRYAIFPQRGGTNTPPAGVGVSVGTNGVSVFEHAEYYLPSLLVYGTSIQDWAHIAVVYANKQPRLYLNGVLVRTGLTSARSFVSPSCTFSDGGNYGKYSGLLDEVSVYDRALTADEIAAIYSAGSNGMCHPTLPPVITQPPTNQTGWVRETAAFSVFASGTPPLSYQWRKDGVVLTNDGRISGAQTNVLQVVNLSTNDAGSYSVVVTNAFGTNSASAVLTVLPPPGYWDVVADFSTNANPNGVWSYGWATNAGGAFQLVTNRSTPVPGVAGYWNGLNVPNGSSLWANLTAAPILLSFIWYDLDTLCIVPQSNAAVVRFTAPTNGLYQVQGFFRLQDATPHAHDLAIGINTNLIGYSTNTSGGQLDKQYPFAFPCPLRGGDTLDFIVSSRDWQATATGLKAKVALTTNTVAPPWIDVGPTDQAVAQGGTATFSVLANGTPPLNYQWQKNGVALTNDSRTSGAQSNILQIVNLLSNDAGRYSVVVSNAFGAVTSVVATLTVDASELYVSSLAPSGLVTSNVSHLRVQFSQGILPGTFTPDDIVVQGPTGTLNSSSFTITPVDAQTFLVSIPEQNLAGTYTVQIGPAITNLAGAPMTGGVFVPVYSSDFETGTGGAWSRGETINSAVSTRFLGEFANDTATLLVAALAPHDRLRLEWDLLIIDTWDGNGNPGPDYFGFNISGLPQPAWEYTFHNNGNPASQS